MADAKAVGSPPSLPAGEPRIEYLVTCERVKFCRRALSSEEFDVVIEETTVRGFVAYIVEQWLTDRQHFLNSVVVYTGAQEDVLKVSVLRFSKSPPDQVLPQFRDAGMRPMETPLGFLMVTTLSRVSSMLNLVPLGGADYEDALHQIVVSVNLRRHGCSGRAAVSLKHPEVAMDRFRTMYNIHTSVSFEYAVVELTRLVQASLYLFGLLPLHQCDGLLCDETVEALKKYAAQNGPIETDVVLADDVVIYPKLVAHLLSSVMVVRVALSALTYLVPKDPFSDPNGLSRALGYYQQSKDLEVTGIISLKLMRTMLMEGALQRQASTSILKGRSNKTDDQLLKEMKPMTNLLMFGKTTPVERLRYLWTGHGRPHDDRDDPLVGYGDGAAASGTPRDSSGPKLGRSIKNAVADLVSKPLEGARESGTLGFLKGVGEGFAGSIANTVDGFRGLGKDRSSRDRKGAGGSPSVPGGASTASIQLPSPMAAASPVPPPTPLQGKQKKRRFKGGAPTQLDMLATHGGRGQPFSPYASPGPLAWKSPDGVGAAWPPSTSHLVSSLAHSTRLAPLVVPQASTPNLNVSLVPNELLPPGISVAVAPTSPRGHISDASESDDSDEDLEALPTSADLSADGEMEEASESVTFAEERLEMRIKQLRETLFDYDKKLAVMQAVYDMRAQDCAHLEQRLRTLMTKSEDAIKEVERAENVASMLQYQLQISEERLIETDELIDAYMQMIEDMSNQLEAQEQRWFRPLLRRIYLSWTYVELYLPQSAWLRRGVLWLINTRPRPTAAD